MTLDSLLRWYFTQETDGASIPCSYVRANPCRCRGERVHGETCPACGGSGTVYELRVGGRDATDDVSQSLARRCDVGCLLSALTAYEMTLVRARYTNLAIEDSAGWRAKSDAGKAGAMASRDSAGANGREIAETRQRATEARVLWNIARTERKRIEKHDAYRRAMKRLTQRLGLDNPVKVL